MRLLAAEAEAAALVGRLPKPPSEIAARDLVQRPGPSLLEVGRLAQEGRDRPAS